MDSKGLQPNVNEDIQRNYSDKVLRCPLCLGTYDTPRALACLHTFCEPCLEFHITDLKASVKDGRLGKIECPVCRHPTVPPDTLKHPHAMVRDFQLNHFILPHLETTTPRSRPMQMERRNRSVHFTQYCGSCSERRSVVLATSYCQDCEDFQCNVCVDNHAKIKMLTQHKIVAISNVTSGTLMASALSKHNHCQQHQKQVVRFYCADHEVLVCSDCVMESHKACEILVEFDDLGLKIKQNDENSKLHGNLKGLQKALGDMIDVMRTNTFGIKRESEEIPKRIQSMKAKVLRLFQYLEEATETNIQRFQDEYTQKNSDKSFRCKQLMSAIEASCLSLETVLEHGTYTQIFLTFQKIKAQLQQYDTLVKDEKDSLVCTSIQFKVEDALETIVNVTEQLGKIYVETAKPNLAELPQLLFARKEPSFDDMKPDLIKSGELKGPVDEHIQRKCIAAAYMDKKVGLVFEVKNRTWFSNSFCLVNADTMEEMHTIDLKRDPKNVIPIDANNVAITFPNAGLIEFYLYTPKRKKKPLKFELDHAVKCDIRDSVISRHSKREFAVSTSNHFSTMTHDGVMRHVFYYSVSLRTRETDFWSTQLQIEHVVVDFKKKRIYLVSSKPDKLYSFNVKGDVMFDYTFDKQVTSLDLDKDGNVFICSGNSETAILSQISPNTGKLLRMIAVETKCPKLCLFNKKQGDIYLIDDDFSKTRIDKYRLSNQNTEGDLFTDD